MKISLEIFSSVYKIILHLTPLLAEQHELMIFKSELNVIHRTGSDYTPTKHRPSALGSKRMRRPESKANGLYINSSISQADQLRRQVCQRSSLGLEAVR